MKSTRCILSIILGLLAGWLPLGAVTVLKNLQLSIKPSLGIDVSQPRFNWQMESDRYGPVGRLIGYGWPIVRSNWLPGVISMIRERFFPGNRSA